MKNSIKAVLDYIHRNGLDNAQWNIELESVHADYYGEHSYTREDLPPHIVLYGDTEPTHSYLNVIVKSDFAICLKDGQMLFFFTID